MESATRYTFRVVARWSPIRRRRRCSSPLWLRTATTFLVAATGRASRASVPLASAFSIRNISGRSGSPGGLFALGGKKRSDADTTQAAFTTHSTLSELLKEFDYDALILDQFGVLHNGKHALDGAIDCVEAIASGANAADPSTERNQKKLQLIVLSNTSSPSETTLDRLEMKLGFDRSYFCGAVTSGEEAARHIRETYGTNEDGSKQKFVWCTWDSTNENVPDPSAFLDLCGPNVEPTLDIASSDFVVAHGSGAIRGFETKDGKVELEIRSMGSFLDDGNLKEGTPINALLGECADRKLPLICANPDMVVQYHDGSLKHMPGKIAQRYREILEERSRSSNGKTDKDLPSITIYGKPHTEHFEACLRELEDDRRQRGEGSKDETKPPTPLRVAHVGDSLHHDVAGANASGVPSIFIVGGIHAEELLSQNDTNKKGMPSEAKLRELFDKEGITPTHVLPVFNY